MLFRSVELYQDLKAESQNRWPSLHWDVGVLNDVISPLLPAGFYYKTFKWPAWAWKKLYEPAIRAAAGLGAGLAAVGAAGEEREDPSGHGKDGRGGGQVDPCFHHRGRTSEIAQSCRVNGLGYRSARGRRPREFLSAS
mgnify:CR=1 FL=1